MTLSDPSLLQPFLDRLIARSQLGAPERQAILDLPGQLLQVQTNRDFVRLGERVDHASLIVEGLVGRFDQIRDGNRQITAVHIPSDMVNLDSVVAPEACSALQALSFTTVVQVPHHALRDVARRYPAIAEAFWRQCVIDAAVLSEWVVNVGRRNARTRLAHLICEMACRMGSIGRKQGDRFEFPATQGHVADMLGLTAVHVNRVLRSLREENIVVIDTRSLTVLDWPRLMKAGEFDPAYLSLAPSDRRTEWAPRPSRPEHVPLCSAQTSAGA